MQKQAHLLAPADNLLEDLAQDIALPEMAVTVHRESRMVGDFVLQAKAAEPPAGHVEWRSSICPELMIRMLLVGYCYSIRLERRLC
jgi:hypothetical protein